MLARELVQDADDLVFHPAQPLGAAAAVTILQQQLLGLGAAVGERGLQPLRQQRAQFAVAAAMGLGQLFQVGGTARARRSVRSQPRAGCSGDGRARVIDGEGGHAIAIAEAER